MKNITDFEACEISADDSAAILLEFGIDMNTGSLILTFDDTIAYNTFIPESLTLQSSRVASSGVYQLHSYHLYSTGDLTTV